MNRSIAIVIFVSTVAAPTVAAAQTLAGRLPVWIAQSATLTEASSPAAASVTPGTSQQTPASSRPRLLDDWSAVLKLRPTETLAVTADGWTGPQPRMFVAADAGSVTFVNLALPSASNAARRALRNAVRQHAADVAGVPLGRSIRIDALELRTSGVFFQGRRIADLEEVVERVGRDGVATIARTSGPRGSARAAGIGAAAGFVAGFLSLANAIMGEHVEHPRANAFAGAGIIWMPVVGGVLGYQLSKTELPGTIVYMR